MSTLTCSPGAAASRRAGRRSASPVQQAAAVVSVVLAAHPVAAWAKDLNLTYTMALPTGASQVSVVNSNSPSTIQAYLLLNLDKDLRGQVTVDRISVSTVGAQSSATAYYDVELYLTGKVLPLSTQQFSSGQNTPLFSITQAPVQYHYVLHQLAPGAVNATGCYDFVADTQCAPADLVPGAVRNVLNTETNGLTAAVFSWSGRPYTAFDISQVTFSFSGKIDNYQITPGLLKKTPVGIPAGDTAFNALSFVSADALVIDGDFTNRSLAKFDNQSELTLNGSFVNQGQAKTSGNIYNNGIFRNASTGTLDVSHYFFNSFFSDGSAGFENAGTVNVGGSTPFFASGPTASFTNSGRFNVNDASLGTAVLLGGTVTN
jgi:hypothetical protein